MRCVCLFAESAKEAVVGFEGGRLEELVEVDQVFALKMIAELSANWQLNWPSGDRMVHIHDYLLSAHPLLLPPLLDHVLLGLQYEVIRGQLDSVLQFDHGHYVEDEGGLCDLLQFQLYPMPALDLPEFADEEGEGGLYDLPAWLHLCLLVYPQNSKLDRVQSLSLSVPLPLLLLLG